MCNWLVTGQDGEDQFTDFLTDEPAAQERASSAARSGYTNIQVWERRYNVEAVTTVTMILPNERREVLKNDTGGTTN